MKHLDLFTGIGGWTLGLEPLGFIPVLFSDNNPYCKQVLTQKFPDVTYVDNVQDVPDVEADIITGSFPCQPFSLVNMKSRNGYDDERYLWPYVHEKIKSIRPQYFAVENVAALTNVQGSPFFADVGTLSEEYAVVNVIATASSIGAPHRRSRLFVLGVRHDVPERMQSIHHTPYWNRAPTMNPWYEEGPQRTPQSVAYGNAVIPQLVTQLVGLLMSYKDDVSQYLTAPWSDRWGDVRIESYVDVCGLPWIKFKQQKTPFYTPIASDFKGSSDKGTRRYSLADQARQAARAHGILSTTVYPNPDFMGWLMGFPQGWLHGTT